jgi:hypothetical protein
VSAFSKVVPWKNSTLLIDPSESFAVALMVMLAGAVNTVLFTGFVMLTVGAALLLTLTAIAVEVVAPLLLSVALAVSE